jgi:hypothetical protein
MPTQIKWSRDKRVLYINPRCNSKEECLICCREVIRVLRELTAKRTRFAIFMDWSKVNTSNIKCVSEIVQFMKDNKAQNRECIIGSAIVMASTTMRTLLNMCFAIQRPVTEIKMFKSHTDACSYIETIRPSSDKKIYV